MGILTGLEGSNLPKYVRRLGSTIAECYSVRKVHFARMRHDNDTRQILSFRESNGGRFIAELALNQKKYCFDITPDEDAQFPDCGTAVIRAIREYIPDLPIEGEELFCLRPINMFMEDATVSISSAKTITPLSVANEDDVSLHDGNDMPRTNDTHTCMDSEIPPSLTVPDTIWNVRTLAVYHAALEWIFNRNDPSEYMLIDDHHGKIRTLTDKMLTYFSTSAGSISRALHPLRLHHVVEKETADNIPTGWWIVRFVPNAPQVNEDLNALWDSRKGHRGKPLLSVLPCDQNETTHTVSKTLDSNVPVDQLHEGSQSKSTLPDGFDAKMNLFQQLEESLRADARERMNTIYQDIAAFCGQQTESIAHAQIQCGQFFTSKDSLKAKDITALLQRLLGQTMRED